MLAGLLEASAEGMDAFRVRDGFNVLYHALAQGDDALQQVRRNQPTTPYLRRARVWEKLCPSCRRIQRL